MALALPLTRGGRFCRPRYSRIAASNIGGRCPRIPTRRDEMSGLKPMKRLLLIAVGVLIAFPFSTSAQKPQSAKKYVKQGLERFGRNDIVGAIAEYDRAINVDPTYAEAYLNRGKARRAAGDLDGAIEDFELTAGLAPALATNNHDITGAYLNRGYIRSNRMDIEGALADFDHAIKYNPNDAEAYFKRGRAFLIIGNAKFAIADFDKSIAIDDRNPLVFAERGYARQTQGQSSEAQKDFERGLKLNNDLRLMLDLHLLDLQMQIKEMERRLSAIKKNIA